MGIAALVAWVLTAGGGFVMLARWISRGGLRQQGGGGTRFPAALVFGFLVLFAMSFVGGPRSATAAAPRLRRTRKESP